MPSIELEQDGRFTRLIDYSILLGSIVFPSDSRKSDNFLPEFVERVGKGQVQKNTVLQSWNRQVSRKPGIDQLQARLMILQTSARMVADSFCRGRDRAH